GVGRSSATTDATGHFSLRGVVGKRPRVVVVSADGHMAKAVQASGTDQDLKITLPEPGTLIVHFDIPGDEAEARVEAGLRTDDLEMPLWKNVLFKPTATVPNGGQIVLTN